MCAGDQSHLGPPPAPLFSDTALGLIMSLLSRLLFTLVYVSQKSSLSSVLPKNHHGRPGVPRGNSGPANWALCWADSSLQLHTPASVLSARGPGFIGW